MKTGKLRRAGHSVFGTGSDGLFGMKNTDRAEPLLELRLDLAKPDLPGDAEEPIVSEIDLSEFPVMVINLAAEYPLARLKEVAFEYAFLLDLEGVRA